MKNISKTTQIALVAVSLSAIILSVSITQISAVPDQGDNKALAEVQKLREVMEPYSSAKSELKESQKQLQSMISDGNGTSAEIAKLQSKVEKLKQNVANYENILDQMEQERIERYKIESALEQKLRVAQDDAVGSDLPLVGVSVSGLHHALVVTVDANQITAEKNESYYTDIIERKYADLTVHVKFDTIVDASCTHPSSNCNPLIGGIKMEAKNHSYCTIGLPMERDGVDGFITAGHCVDDASGSGDDVFQPTEDWLGWNKVGDVEIDLYQAECDCAWVEQSSEDDSEQAVWSNTNDWTTITGFTDRSAAGANIVIHGATSNLDYGIVDDPESRVYIDEIWFDVVSTTTDVMDRGDSGGAVTNSAEDNFHGMNKATSSSASYYTPWENINDSTTGLGPLS